MIRCVSSVWAFLSRCPFQEVTTWNCAMKSTRNDSDGRLAGRGRELADSAAEWGGSSHHSARWVNANAAWLGLAVIGFKLTRAAGTLASTFHAKATTATIRTRLITVPARIARSARPTWLHLPQHWSWESAWQALLTAASGPSAAGT